jgi:hydrogenase-4 component F
MGAFSLAGTPPFSIFISELMVIQAGLAAGRYVTVAIFLVMVVLIFAGLIHHVGQMVFGVAPASASRAREAPLPLFGMLLLVAVMVVLGVCMPAGLDRVLSRATEIILG